MPSLGQPCSVSHYTVVIELAESARAPPVRRGGPRPRMALWGERHRLLTQPVQVGRAGSGCADSWLRGGRVPGFTRCSRGEKWVLGEAHRAHITTCCRGLGFPGAQTESAVVGLTSQVWARPSELIVASECPLRLLTTSARPSAADRHVLRSPPGLRR